MGYMGMPDCMAATLPLSALRTASIKLKAVQSVQRARLLMQTLNGASLWNTTGCTPMLCSAQASADYTNATNAVSRQLVANIGRWPQLAQDTASMMRSWHYQSTPPLDVQQRIATDHTLPYNFRHNTSFTPIIYPQAHIQDTKAMASNNGTPTAKKNKHTQQALKTSLQTHIATDEATVLQPITMHTGVDHRSVLLAQAIALRDADNEETVKTVLQRLKQANIAVFGLPCEDLDCHAQIPKLYAATMDTLLLELASVIRRWPDLAQTVGRIVLSWQYCDIRYRNRSRDLVYRQYRMKRLVATGPSPVIGQGWQQWGFNEQDDDRRLIPYPARHHGLGGAAKAEFLHRYIQQRCFPDPETGRTPYDPTELMYSGPTHDFPEQQEGGSYPYMQQWRAVSNTPTPAATKKVEPSPTKNNKHRDVIQQPTAIEPKKIHKPSPSRSSTTQQHMPKLPSQPSMQATQKQPKKDTTLTTPKNLPSTTTTDDPAHPIHPRHDIPMDEQTPAASPPASSPAAKRIQGDAHIKWKLNNAQAELGVNALWNPFSYFYLRGGISAKLTARHSRPAYTWGFGYNDWHPGGWVVEFNQWNPQQLGLGSSIKNAEFNVAYRLPLAASWEPYLSGTLNAGLTGTMPNLGAQWQLKYHDYFARFGIQKDLRGLGGWQWTYGFGRWNWRAGSLNLEYANWGSNRAFQPNFRRNGEIILEYRWDY